MKQHSKRIMTSLFLFMMKNFSCVKNKLYLAKQVQTRTRKPKIIFFMLSLHIKGPVDRVQTYTTFLLSALHLI